MDKLARLMAPDPQFIQPWLLAEQDGALTGVLELGSMPRLHEFLASECGEVGYQLQFGKDPEGISCILGTFAVSLQVYCQRCLNTIAVDIEREITVGLVAAREDAEALPDQYEPLLVTGGQLSLAGFIEEEILLAMPMAPVHDVDECPANGMIEKWKPTTEKPFSILKEFKFNYPKD